MTSRAATAAVAYAALRTAAHVADHWFQTGHQATNKSDFHALGGPLGGAYILDQSAHHLMEGVAAVLAGRK